MTNTTAKALADATRARGFQWGSQPPWPQGKGDSPTVNQDRYHYTTAIHKAPRVPPCEFTSTDNHQATLDAGGALAGPCRTTSAAVVETVRPWGAHTGVFLNLC